MIGDELAALLLPAIRLTVDSPRDRDYNLPITYFLKINKIKTKTMGSGQVLPSSLSDYVLDPHLN